MSGRGAPVRAALLLFLLALACGRSPEIAQAEQLLAQGKGWDAAAALTALLEREPTNLAAHRLHVEALLADGQTLSAALAYERMASVLGEDPDLLARVARLVLERAASGESMTEQLAAAEGLARLGDPTGLARLRALASEGPWPLRVRARAALSGFEALPGTVATTSGAGADLGRLGQALNDLDHRVRLEAAQALARLPAAQVGRREALLRAADDRVVEVAVAALAALSERPSDRHRAVLLRSVEHGDVAGRTAALGALRELGDPRHEALVRRWLGDPEPEVRAAGARLALAGGLTRLVSQLRPLLLAPEPEVRCAGAAALLGLVGR